MAHHSVRRGPRCGADHTPFMVTLGTVTPVPVTDCRVPVTHRALGKCWWALRSCSPQGQTPLFPVHAEQRSFSLRSTGVGGGVTHSSGTLTLARWDSVGSGRRWTPALCPSRFTDHPAAAGRPWAPARPRPVPTRSTRAPGALRLPSLRGWVRGPVTASASRERITQCSGAGKALPAPSRTRGWGGRKSVRSPSPRAGWMGRRPPMRREKRLALTFLAFWTSCCSI